MRNLTATMATLVALGAAALAQTEMPDATIALDADWARVPAGMEITEGVPVSTDGAVPATRGEPVVLAANTPGVYTIPYLTVAADPAQPMRQAMTATVIAQQPADASVLEQAQALIADIEAYQAELDDAADLTDEQAALDEAVTRVAGVFGQYQSLTESVVAERRAYEDAIARLDTLAEQMQAEIDAIQE